MFHAEVYFKEIASYEFQYTQFYQPKYAFGGIVKHQPFYDLQWYERYQ